MNSTHQSSVISSRKDLVNDMVHTLTEHHKSNKDNFKFGLLNVNSIRHKIYDIHEVLSNHLLDCIMLQETKLYDSFPNSQFHLQGYDLYRADHKHTLTKKGITFFDKKITTQKKSKLAHLR